MIDRSLVKRFDGWFLVVILIILGLGVLSIYSVTSNAAPRDGLEVYQKQMVWIAMGLVVFCLAAFFDYHELARYGTLFYIGTVIMLVLVLWVGRTGMGAQRWLSLGPFDVQPSEWVKLAVVFILARYFSRRNTSEGLGLGEMIVPGFLVGIPLVLVIKQPDLGTSLVLLFIFGVMVALIGLRSRTLGFSFLISLMAFPFAWEVFWNSLRTYQKNRLLAYIDPSIDPTGKGYHALQSKIAVGSGGWFGKGLFGGSQTQLRFLPEGHTDFIFAVFAEAWGFLGAAVLLGLYFYLFWWAIETAKKAQDRLGVFLAVGVISLLLFYVIVNIGMTVGLVPVVGVPLPLMSYGGNAMLTTMACLGLLVNIRMRRFSLFYG